LAYRLRTSLPDMSQNGRPAVGQALKCPPGTEYDESAFRYFLGIERARAERSNRPVRLLFATMEPVPGQPAPIPAASATKLFEGLRQTLRETDVMGWYQQGRVAGAVLSARPGASGSDTPGGIEERVGEGLRQRLPSKIARGVRVRVVQMRPRRFGNA
jgi:hypothetical protein